MSAPCSANDATQAMPNGDNDDIADRNLAYLVYGLLFFSVFFAGAPALVAIAIAYARRGDVSPLVASHHRFQIVIFWVAMVLAMVAGLCVLGALGSLIANLARSVSHERSWSLDSFSLEVSDLHLPVATITFGVGAMIATLLTGFWLVIASVFGALRLASGRAIGQSRR